VLPFLSGIFHTGLLLPLGWLCSAVGPFFSQGNRVGRKLFLSFLAALVWFLIFYFLMLLAVAVRHRI
jgi:hypothetical protein